jgi:enoyl-CoA hydratase/carnithine racemase
MTTRSFDEAGLRLDVETSVATVTLSRPETRNAQSPLTWAALREIGSSLPAAVRVVVVAADGPSFSSGLDRRMLTPAGLPGEPSLLGDAAPHDEEELEQLLARYQEAFVWLRAPGRVSVAAVHGHAIGAGFQLSLACDLRVVAADARFAMRETSLGLVPDLGGTRPLVEAIGYSRALEICLTGRELDAAEAYRVGLATVVVPPPHLAAAVADLTAALLAPPHGAVTATKALLQDASGRSYADQLAAERSAQVLRIHELTGRPGNKASAPGVGHHDE